MLRKLFPGVYEGWIVVLSTSTVLFVLSASVFYGFGVVFNPIRQEFGWGAGTMGLAFSVRSEVNGIAAPFVGTVIDRVGAQRVLLVGLAIVATSVFLISYMQELWQFYALMLLMAVGTSTSGGQVSMISSVSWFRERRAQAIGLATAGGAAGGVLTVLIAALEDAFGWRGTLRVMALVLFFVGGFVALNVRTRPANHPQPMDGRPRARTVGETAERESDERWGVPPREAIRTMTFWMLAVAQIAFFFVWTAVVVHHFPFIELQGLDPKAAGLGTAALSVAALASRLTVTPLADRYGRRELLILATVLMTAALPLLLLVESVLGAIVVMSLIGFTAGVVNPLRTTLIADYFGTRHFGAINGISMFVGTLGAFVGPFAVGALLDWTGSYASGWLLTAAVAATSIPAAIAARRPKAMIARFGGSADSQDVAAPTDTAVSERAGPAG